jgi:hypothetical protein
LSAITSVLTPRRKQVYKITYPNGKIYVGMDLTGSLLYFGSPSDAERIVADHEAQPHDFTSTLRKQILWESETATDAEVRARGTVATPAAPTA